jgi:hypothetical protein
MGMCIALISTWRLNGLNPFYSLRALIYAMHILLWVKTIPISVYNYPKYDT